MSPKIRESLYQLASVLLAGLGLAQVWGGVDGGTVDNISQIVTGLLTLLGAGAPAVAAKKVNTQRKDGTLDTVAPADQVINGVQAVIEARAAAQAEVDRVKQAVNDIAATVPVLGPLATQVINSIPKF